MDLKVKLNYLDDSFFEMKRKYDYTYFWCALIYLLVLSIVASALSRYFPGIYSNNITRYLLMFLAAGGLASHFVLKSTYLKCNKNYSKLISRELSEIRDSIDRPGEYREQLRPAIQEIISEKGLSRDVFLSDSFLFNLDKVFTVEEGQGLEEFLDDA